MLYHHCCRKCHLEVQVNQDGLKFNDIYQFLVYADYVNIMGGSIHTMMMTIKSKKDAICHN